MNWLSPPEVSVPDDFSAAIGGHPLVAQVLYRRGVTDLDAARAFLNPAFYLPSAPLELPGMALAVDRLEHAIHQGEKICVWGDFDVDGQTSTTLLVSMLGECGAQVIYHIPVRAQESHGVNLPVLRRILEVDDPDVRVVLTCDTGITAHAAMDYARERGVDVVITDHHELPPVLPSALAVVNPRLLPEEHALATLPGVGVAFKLAEELYARLGRPEAITQHYDLAALGIVADVALQTGEARFLVQRGLESLRRAERLGLKVMMELAELEPGWLTEEHIGYSLGPRLNALGRLSDANPVVELLTTQDEARARTLAYQLEGLNSKRQMLTSQVYRAALAQIEQDPALLDPASLVLAHPGWPAGVIGIVASRLVERYHKPVALIAIGESSNRQDETSLTLGRGSARSIEGVDITAAIAAQADLLEGFGGHRMAAGFSIRPEQIAEFRRRLAQHVQQQMTALESADDSFAPEAFVVDGYLELADLSLELVTDLERLAPFGAGNPPLILASRHLRLLHHSTLGRNQEHFMLTVQDGNEERLPSEAVQRVIWWQGADEVGDSLPEGLFDLAYTVRTSTYRGQRSVQMTLVALRSAETAPLPEMRRELEIIDCRQELYPLPVLERLLADHPEALVWAEAEAATLLTRALGEEANSIQGRQDLSACSTLVIWTPPPGRCELHKVLDTVQPRRVILFAVEPGLDMLEPFLKRLVGLVKYTLQASAGQTTVDRLAQAMAHRPQTLRLGLLWMAAQGYITFQETNGELVFVKGGKASVEQSQAISGQICALLDESAAFRAFYRRAAVNSLISR